MTTPPVKAFGIVVLCAAMVVGAAYAAGRSSASRGAAPYTPSQLEWFVVKLNAAQRALPTETLPGFWFQEGGTDTVMVLLTGCGGSMKVSDIMDRAEEAEALAKSWGSGPTLVEDEGGGLRTPAGVAEAEVAPA